MVVRYAAQLHVFQADFTDAGGVAALMKTIYFVCMLIYMFLFLFYCIKI